MSSNPAATPTNTPTYTRIEYDRFGKPSLLHPSTPIPTPSPLTLPPTHVLIKTLAVSVNPKDTFARKGVYWYLTGRNFPMGTGTDFSGVVQGVGSHVHGVKVGDRVWGGLNGFTLGTLAEVLVLPESQVAAFPDCLTEEEAACFPVAALTALQALRDLGKLEERSKIVGKPRVIVNGASGGVGHFAVQLAKKCYGAHVTALCSEANFEFVRNKLGADVALDYRAAGVRGNEDKLSSDETGQGDKFDVWFDCFGNRSYSQVSKQLKPGGIHITTVPSVREFFNSYLLTGWFGSSSSSVVVVNICNTELEKLGELVAKHGIRPSVDASYEYLEANKAQEHVEGKRTKGKVVIRVGNNTNSSGSAKM